MKSALLLALTVAANAAASPRVTDPETQVTYEGISRNGLDVFLNIPYGQDTSGEHRFKPPRPYVPEEGSTIMARSFGPACPQETGNPNFPLTLSNIFDISEDCLNLNIVRPPGLSSDSKLPVMIYIHGGKQFYAELVGFWTGSNADLSYEPDGMILESMKNEMPIIHVSINYRLGLFGFAISDALREEKSTNAGLRDQRLAFEWVRDNIEVFGGDPSKVTIFGQSSGGLAVGLHTMAYGGTKPVPFQQGICQSQALEPGITGDFTINEMKLVAGATGCNTTDLHSPETIACLRDFDTEPLLNKSIEVHVADISNNIGDSWLPTVDGDFLPDAPSTLVSEGRFAKVRTMIGWTEEDVTYYTPQEIYTEEDTFNFVSSYLPAMTDDSVKSLLELYPSSDFSDDPTANRTAQFYRSARMFRDIIMTCMPIWYGENLARKDIDVYLYDFNQTLVAPILAAIGSPGLGAIHTSEFAYVFGNISHYDIPGYPFDPVDSDRRLAIEASRSWSSFASVGRPSVRGKETLKGWEKAFARGNNTSIYVAGGPSAGLSPWDGRRAKPAIRAQKLRERCMFLNSPEIREQMQF
ncbi:uncharacterized protein CIMG_00118 [Coccidioides immitis RS]|uniref:Carboxylic ester hydrolase n=2 Tax=Coccidioides immitis TaxID=5501 RepID=J3KGB6_COCIM|nr:uncharacterized protein CIMG_00118 [Coccidioides immitis RS]EAS34764.3 hypothetical protein CIMG_00118 [Coccidioides immitis RS]KMO99938.1 carboxylesterase 2 [Coccidioides immitis RMSCC 2394]